MVVIATITQVVNVIKRKESLELRSIGWLGFSGLLGILAGFWIVDYDIFPEQRLVQSLAILTIGYALSALFIPTLPHLTHNRFAPVAGFVSGILTGAYNIGETAGDYVCQRSPLECRANPCKFERLLHDQECFRFGLTFYRGKFYRIHPALDCGRFTVDGLRNYTGLARRPSHSRKTFSADCAGLAVDCRATNVVFCIASINHWLPLIKI
jgi:hypothetical protein